MQSSNADPGNFEMAFTAIPAGLGQSQDGRRTLKVNVVVTFDPAIKSPAEQFNQETRDLLLQWPSRFGTSDKWRNNLKLTLESVEVKDADITIEPFTVREAAWNSLVLGAEKVPPSGRDVDLRKRPEPKAKPVSSYGLSELKNRLTDLRTNVIRRRVEEIASALSPEAQASAHAVATSVGTRFGISRQLDVLHWFKTGLNDNTELENPANNNGPQTFRSAVACPASLTEALVDLGVPRDEAIAKRDIHRLSHADPEALFVVVESLLRGTLVSRPGELQEPPDKLSTAASSNVLLSKRYLSTRTFLDCAVYHSRVPKAASSQRQASAASDAPQGEEAGDAPVISRDVLDRLASLMHSPMTRRFLGLIICLEFPVPAGAATSGKLQVIGHNALKGVGGRVTAYELSSSHFTAASSPTAHTNKVVRGFLKIDDGKFHIHTGDFAAEALQLMTFAHSQGRAAGAVLITTPTLEPVIPDDFLGVIQSYNATSSLIVRTPDDNRTLGTLYKMSGTALKRLVPVAKMTAPKALATPPSDGTCNGTQVPAANPFDLFAQTLSGSIRADSRAPAWKRRPALFTQMPIGATFPFIISPTPTATWRNGTLASIRWQLLGGGGHLEDDEASTALPAPSTVGVCMTWDVRASALQQAVDSRVARYASLRRGTVLDLAKSTLYAEDLVLGYVPMVCQHHPFKPERSVWLSLTRKRERYPDVLVECPRSIDSMLTHGLHTATDHIASADPKSLQPDHYAPPILFRWTGESLAVPEPDAGTLMKDSSADSMTETEREAQDKERQSEVEEGSNPTLLLCSPGRPGQGKYRFAVKAVDIGGYGIEPRCDASYDAAPYKKIACRRREPVPPPAVLLDEQLNDTEFPGRGLVNMVVRSDDPSDTRWIAPPLGPFKLTGLLGLLDTDDLDSVGTFDDVELMSDGTFPLVERLTAPEAATQPTTPGAPVPNDFGNKDPIRRRPGRRPDVPYIPDNFAAGIMWRLLDVDGTVIDAGEQCYADFYPGLRTWPHAKAIRVRLHAASRSSHPRVRYDGLARTLNVHLPPGRSAELQVLSGLGRGEKGREVAECMAAIYEHDYNEQGNRRFPGDPMTAAEAALTGNLPEITPHKSIWCTHAVPTPIVKPRIDGISRMPAKDGAVLPICRFNGDPRVAPQFDLSTHSESTGRMQVVAEWEELVDDVNEPEPQCRSGNLVVGEVTIDPVAPACVHDDAPAPTTLCPGELHPQWPTVMPHEFPSTGYRRVRYAAIAHTRYSRNYGPASAGSVSAGVRSVDVCADVLNVAAPTELVIAYVVPTFRWEQGRSVHDKETFVSTRRGCGLRVFFERPFNGSGNGELVGLFLPPPSASVAALGATPDLPVEDARPYYTRWGHDPMRTLPGDGALLGTLDHTRIHDDFCVCGVHAGIENICLLDEHKVDSPLKQLKLYKPHYDRERRLWYCDVVLKDVHVPYPFVRLSMFRYQQHSTSGNWVSTLSRADFAQLVPDRSVSVHRDPEDCDRQTMIISVRGVGEAPQSWQVADATPPSEPHAGRLRTSFRVRVLASHPDGSWEDDTSDNVVICDASVSTENDRPDRELARFKIRWKRNLQTRRVMVSEEESLPGPDNQPVSRLIYFDVLEM